MAKGGRGGQRGKSRPSRGQLGKLDIPLDKKVQDFKSIGAYMAYKREKTNEFLESQISKDTGINKSRAKEVFNSIKYYVDTGYEDIRNSNDSESDRHRKNIEEFISKSPTYNGVIYRGIKVNDKNYVNSLKKGSIVDMKGISSWSSDIKIANDFANPSVSRGNGYSILFKCKNKTGVGIDHLSFSDYEHEVLHSGKSKFKIDNVNIVGNTYEVNVSEI